ncbi:flagellar biosynthesis protein FlhB [Roseiterribacter gracilis]|uniref:Flagellar biosynthetic protein FlhB n=1 Tax=Roseiterribacter gracilis TaxID=2812848 RepID=A0A8S8XDK0_9PROT|nr:flagellar biosynthesis protein FlhB [Rhodospirillales bacterium TMPK1]
MAEGGDEEGRTEDPTSRRLEEARAKGNIPISKELNNWFVFLSAGLMMMILVPSAARDLAVVLRPFLAQPEAFATDRFALGRVLMDALMSAAKSVGLILLLFFISGLSSSLMQAGFNISGESLKPNLSKINPLKGFGRIFSSKSVIELLKAIAKLSVVSIIVVATMLPSFGGIERFVSIDISDFLGEFRTMTLKAVGGVLAIMTLVAAVDLFFVRWSWWKSLKMSKQEVKDEYKQSEGSPEVKQRQRQLRFDKARRRILQAVPKADVVITNPTHFAVALQYDPEKMQAPVVVAKGVDFLAAKIREIAKEHDITITENPPLARAIYATVDIDHPIKEEHYRAVAEVISYVFKLKRKVMK